MVEHALAHWTWLDDGQQGTVRRVVRRLLDAPRWEAARGFALDDEVRATIAVRAALPVVELGWDAYHRVRTIVVHGGAIVDRAPRPGPFPHVVTAGPRSLAGHTSAYGPVFIAWPTARRQGPGRPGVGDVVIHEFAHKLDLLDGVVDGTPPLPHAVDRDLWVQVCTRELAAVRAGHIGALSAYAAHSPGEFFAVATEAFFTRPTALRDDRPELYLVLAGYYRQDPAGTTP